MRRLKLSQHVAELVDDPELRRFEVEQLAFESDEDLSAVLAYVRNSFGNKSPVIPASKIQQVRESVKSKQDFYNVLNAATPLAYNQAFIQNGAWLTPTQVLGRGASYGFVPGPTRRRILAPILTMGLMGGGTAGVLASAPKPPKP